MTEQDIEAVCADVLRLEALQAPSAALPIVVAMAGYTPRLAREVVRLRKGLREVQARGNWLAGDIAKAALEGRDE
jgi:hypothetical protein